ncbi:MAG: aldo/keto reductase [Sphaerochaetaceae bacterium]|nr:aldo/keto reductase [Sphaerochaetaceae bacterium]
MTNFKSVTTPITLSNGIKIPCVGFGTWQTPDGDVAYSSVMAALEYGYRHIDTATAYGNEESVGRAINDFLKKSGVKREELFITTKLWNKHHSYELATKAIDESLRMLGLEYIDLYLVHWPNPVMFRDHWKEANRESWKAMEEAYEKGKLRALGLSNFRQHHIDELLKTAKVKPVMNQIKLCPGICQDELVAYSRSLGMAIEAYSPMGTGGLLGEKTITDLSAKYSVTPAQLCIRYSLQKGYIPLPKSVTPERIKANMDVFGFEIEAEDIKVMDTISHEGLGISPNRDPDTTNF